MNTTIKKSFSISAILGRAWELFKKNWEFLILAGLAVIATEIILAVLIENTPLVLSMLFALASWIIQILYTIGFMYIFVSIARDKKPSWNYFTQKANLFGKYLIGAILFTVGLVIGLIFLILPGIYFALRYGFWYYVLIENPEIGIIDSFKKSAEITNGVKWKIFGAGFIFTVVSMIGVLLIGLGLFITLPLAAIATALMYTTLRDQTDGVQDTVHENTDALSPASSKKNNTLIILIVFGAIILVGITVLIVSSVGLGALESAGQRARDTAARATLSQVRAEAQSNGSTYDNVCDMELIRDAEVLAGRAQNSASCLDESNTPDSSGYAVSIKLSNTTFCVDSTGAASGDATAQTIGGNNICN